MQVEIIPLRNNGFRLPARSQNADQVKRGALTIGHRWITPTQSRLAAELRTPGTTSPGDEALIAVIYEPQIKAMHGSCFNLTGWEIIDWKSDGRQIVMQEWACTITAF